MRRYGWIALVALAADQLSKAWARRLTEPITMIPGLLGLTYAENTGMAFSLFSGRPWLLGILSVVLIVTGTAVLRRYRLGPWSRVSAMMMLGGALGNMIDRFFTGYVVDMIEVLAFRFAIFNVADVFLTAGCILMALSLLMKPDEWSEKHGNTEGNPV